MNKPTAREMAIQKSIELSEQEALKVLIFMAGMEAGKSLEYTENLEVTQEKNGQMKMVI